MPMLGQPPRKALTPRPSRSTTIIVRRQPSEELGFGKFFPIKEGVSFSLRADFFNVFNRWVYPGFNNTSNPAATGTGNQLFGVMAGSITNAGGNYAPRSGEFVARIQF